MKNESIFQRKRKKVFSFVYQDLFHFHTFIHFFLSCWRNEIPKDIFFFFLFNGMESKFTFGVIIFIASDRSEFQKWKIEIERSKKDVRNFGYKSFFSISPSHFFIFEAFLSLLRRQEKKVSCFFGCHNLHQMSFRNDKNVSMMLNSCKKSILIVFRHNMSFKFENGQAYKKFLVRD